MPGIFYAPELPDNWAQDTAPDDAAEALDKLAAERADGPLVYCADDLQWYRIVCVVTGGVPQLTAQLQS